MKSLILLSGNLLLFLLSFQVATCQQTKKANQVVQGPKHIWTIEWSYDGKFIAVGGDDSTIWIFNGADYKLYRSFKTNSMVKCMSWHPKENLLAISNMKGVQFLDMSTEKLKEAEEIKAGGRGIGWNFSGELLALADGYGVVQVMNKEGKILRSIRKHNRKSYLSLDWHPSKNIIVTGGDEIILFDTSGRQLNLITVREQYTGILSVKWHPSGEFFASGDYGHEKEGKPTLLQFWKPDGTKLVEKKGHHEEIRNLRWSKDGKFVATAADALRIWDTKGKLLWEGASETNLWGIAWSRNDKFIITGTYSDGIVKLWNSHAKLVKVVSE